MLNKDLFSRISRYLTLVIGFAVGFIGLVSLLNGIVAWYTSGQFLWLSFVYAFMNGILAYGLTHFKRWTISILVVNFVSILALFTVRWGMTSVVPNLAPLVFATALASFVSVNHRRFVSGGWYEAFPCTAFLVLWLISTGYNYIIAFKELF